MSGKPAAEELGVDLATVRWQRAGSSEPGPGEEGALEVATVARPEGGIWVLVRVAGDPDGRVLAYDEHEWECFLDGVRNGEFDVPV